MALSSGVRGPNAGTRTQNSRPVSLAKQILWPAFITALVAGPWFGPGYLFGTDWPGARRYDFPNVNSSAFLLQAALALLSRAVGGELTGKLFIIGVLFVAAATAYKALPTPGLIPKAVASSVYLVNPFVYARLHYGQLLLLAGYAILPWAAHRLRLLLLEPSAIRGIVAAVSFGLVGLLSIHVFMVAAVLASAAVLTRLLSTNDRLVYVRRLTPGLLFTVGLTLAINAYWVIPLLMGKGREGATVAGITSGDLIVYAAIPDQHLGLVPNLLGLYGFWAEISGRFTSMKTFVPVWPWILALLLGVAAIGAAWAFKQHRDQLGAWVTGLLLAAAIAVVLEMGVSNPMTRGLVTWLDANLPIYRGMRDAGKWASLLALVYSQLVGLGSAAILDWIRGRLGAGVRGEWSAAIATGLLVALPLYYGNGLLFGMHGEIKPSQYPAGWYQVDRILVSDPQHGRVLFLPWHEYMSYSFIQNENKVVASPAPTFFSVPVLTSTNPEVPGIAAPTDPEQVAISKLISSGGTGQWPKVLASLGIKYVVLAREVDWESYRYLDGQLLKIGDYGSLVLYRNTLAT